jgi:hypothetical protein
MSLAIKKALVFVFLLFLTLQTNVAYAADCSDGYNTSGRIELVCVVDPFVRFLNGVWLAGGAVFVIMLAISIYKFAMAQGDPKAMEGARNSLTYAIFGGLIVSGLIAIQWLLAVSFGFSDPSGTGGFKNINTPFAQIRKSLEGIQEVITENIFEGWLDGNVLD